MRLAPLLLLAAALCAGESDPQAEFDTRLAKLKPDAIEERVVLAKWAKGKGLAESVTQLCEMVIAAKPDHREARKLLGYELVDKTWLRGEELWKAKKWIPYLGRWMPPIEKQKIITRREALRKQLKERSTWDKAWETKTAHFFVKSNAPYRVVQDIAVSMEQYFTQASKVFSLGNTQARIPVEVYASHEEFSKASAADGNPISENVLGYYMPGRDLIRMYHMGNLDQTLSTLFHECTHLLFNRFAKRDIPTWTNEGLAVFFEDAERLEDKINIFAIPWGRLWQLQEEMKGKSQVDMGDTIDCSHQGYHAGYYPKGWAISHFLLFGAGGKYKKGYDAYIAAHKKGSAENDNRSFFIKHIGKKPSELQAEWEAHVKGMEPKDADDFAGAAKAATESFLDLPRARTYADKAVELAPQSWRSHAARGRVLLVCSRLASDAAAATRLAAEAVASFDEAATLGKVDPAALKAKGKKPDQSIALWTSLLADRIWALIAAGDGERAMTEAGILIDIDEVNAHAYAALALMGSQSADDLDEAAANLAVAQDLGNDHLVHGVGARVALAQGRTADAKRLLKEAAELDRFGHGRVWYGRQLDALDKPAGKDKPAKP